MAQETKSHYFDLMTRAETLAALHDALPVLRAEFGVTRLGLFGSVARDEASPESDVDLVAEFGPGSEPGLRLFLLEERLTALLGRPARISGMSRMNPVLRANVERDLIYA